MTSPHSPYPHPGHGPGPSSYYHQSPPPAHPGYGGPTAGNPSYAYQYPPPPPHMNSHHHGAHQQSGPSRTNGRGGSYSSRYNYYPPPQPHTYPHPNPMSMHPANPYSPQSHKYNPPFSPSYYPNPAAIPYTPARHTPQPISPLPKQLSMPPATGYYEPAEFSPAAHRPSSQIPIVSPHSERLSQEPIQESVAEPLPPAPPSVSEPVEEEPESAELVTSQSENSHIESEEPIVASSSSTNQTGSSYNQMGTILTHDQSTTDPSSQAIDSTSSSSSTERSGSNSAFVPLAIWSRRPHDPSQAPGIIISPRACPPESVLQRAIDARTPPSSPRPRRAAPARIKQALDSTELTGPPSEETPTPVPHDKTKSSSSAVDGAAEASTSQVSSTVPSSAGTDTTDTPTLPGSPVSTTNTSLSVVGTPAPESKVLGPEPGSEAKADGASLDSTGGKPEIAPSNEKKSAPEAPAPATGSAAESAAASASTSANGAIPSSTDPTPSTSNPASSTPTPTPAAEPAAPPVKKSWASLLRPTSSPSGASTSTQKNSLPTSSVVGISVPAEVASSSLNASSQSNSSSKAPSVSPTKKHELVQLLTTTPASSSLASRIRPRGLVNSGNMCFANSVLQVLVYCAPFHRLLAEVGKVLGVSERGAGDKDRSEKNGSGFKASASTTPLVDATAVFLKEFLDTSASANGMAAASASGYGRGKGKEKERREIQDDDWDGESFVPTYIYDAMKEKKRFDTMRGGHQEDAEEFLGFYLDALEEELLSLLNSVHPSKTSHPQVEEKEEAAPPQDQGWMEVGKKNRSVVTRTIKATESPITRIFGGKFRSTLRAARQKDSVVVEDWRSLRLDIQRDHIRTIQDALAHISQPEPVQLSIPTQPGVPVEASQQVLIEALPPILILHIKRFCYDTTVKGVVKVGKQVTYGPELEIGPDLMAPLARKAGPTRYKLFGALYHHGLSASGGHYTLDVLHPNRYPSSNPNAKPREGWVRIDDELVSDVRPEDVFNAQERDDARCAYLLFYRRI